MTAPTSGVATPDTDGPSPGRESPDGHAPAGVPTATDAVVAEPAPDRRVPEAVRAFGYREYLAFWLASVVTNTGSLMALAAIGWVVAVETGSAFKVTLVAFVGLAPLLVLSPLGGSLADRIPRKRFLSITMWARFATATVLAVVYASGLASYWVLFALSIANGATGALQGPVQQAIVPELVPRSALRNAIVLNSAQFNIARALGPMSAGLLIDLLGVGAVFWINIATCLAVQVALATMRPSPVPSADHRSGFLREFSEGVRYAWSVPGIRIALAGAGVLAFVSAPLQWLAPLVARDLFDATATRYGILLGAMGVGAVAGAVLLLAFDRGTPASRLVQLGYPGYALAVAGLALAPAYGLGVVAMAASGGAFIVLASAHNSSVQAVCDDRYRGRVLSLWMMQFGLLAPLGVLIQGSLAGVVGIRWMLLGDAVLLVGYVSWATTSGLLRHLDGTGPETQVHRERVGTRGLRRVPQPDAA